VEAGSPFENVSEINWRVFRFEKPVPTFSEYAIGLVEPKSGETNSGGGEVLRRPFRVVSDTRFKSGRGDVASVSAFQEQ